MRDRTPLRELSKIFSAPEQFSITTSRLSTPLKSSSIVSMRRDRDQIEFTCVDRRGVELLITLPMSVERVERCRVIEMQLQQLTVEVMTSYKIETATFTPSHNTSHAILADVVIQEIPKGRPLTEVKQEDAESILQAISLLERTLHSAKLYFKGSKGITPESVILGSDSRLYPIRYKDLRSGQIANNCCDHLREWVKESLADVIPSDGGTQPTEYPMRQSDLFNDHLSIGHFNEERAIIEEFSGWGFIDRDNNIIVEPIYKRVFPFSEGRAIVLSDNGWGLIDLNGDEVIPSIYNSISYSSTTGLSCVLKGDKWGYFSYLGDQLTPFSQSHPNEDITSQEILSMEREC